MDTPELPLPIKRHEAPKYDVESYGNIYDSLTLVASFVSPLTRHSVSTSPARGEVSSVLGEVKKSPLFATEGSLTITE